MRNGKWQIAVEIPGCVGMLLVSGSAAYLFVGVIHCLTQCDDIFTLPHLRPIIFVYSLY